MNVVVKVRPGYAAEETSWHIDGVGPAYHGYTSNNNVELHCVHRRVRPPVVRTGQMRRPGLRRVRRDQS